MLDEWVAVRNVAEGYYTATTAAVAAATECLDIYGCMKRFQQYIT